MQGGSRWERTDAPRGDDYDARWRDLASRGESIHGEADLVEALVDELQLPRSVLDAGCGTGRVAIELARRGFEVTGVDLDAGMLDTARRKAPELPWVLTDLAAIDLEQAFGAVVMAGNVMIFLAPGTEATVVSRLATHLVAGGVLVAGFQVRADRIALDDYESFAVAAGLEPVARFATWQRDSYAGGDYAVSVHRRP